LDTAGHPESRQPRLHPVCLVTRSVTKTMIDNQRQMATIVAGGKPLGQQCQRRTVRPAG
jgi:hypothetical protein